MPTSTVAKALRERELPREMLALVLRLHMRQKKQQEHGQ
jgi:hypothetical protein